MAQRLPITLLTRSKDGGVNFAPGVQFITPVTGQVPLYIEHFILRGADEQPVALVRMQDGTSVPINQNRLINTSANVYF